MPLKAYVHQLLCKLEAIEGTDPVPTSDDAMLALTPTYQSEQDFIDRDAGRFSMDREFDNVGRAIDKLSFGLDLRGSGEITTGLSPSFTLPTKEPRLGRLFRACSMRGGNMNLVYTTGSPAGMTVNTLIYGSRSGAVGRLVGTNYTTDSWLNLERLNAIPFQAGEALKQGDPNTGASAGAVLSGGATVTLETPMGWFYRPCSAQIQVLDLDNGTPTGEYDGTKTNWKFSDGRYGNYLTLYSNGLRNVLVAGTTITGATSGATAKVLENAIGQTLTISALNATLAPGTVVTGGTSGATGVVTQAYGIGATAIAVVRTSATNFQAAEALTGTGTSPNPNISDVGWTVILATPISGTWRGNEAINGTADPAPPTLRGVEETLNLGSALTTTLGAGTTVTGATSTASGVTVGAYASGATQIVVRRTTAVDFTLTETINGTGSSPNPTCASKNNSLFTVPQDGYIIKGATSGAEGVVRAPRAGNYKVPIPALSLQGTVAAPTYAQTSQTKLYYEPTYGTFSANEVLNDVSGVAIKRTNATLNNSIFQDHSATFYSLKAGRLRSMIGSRGTFKISLAAGQPGKVQFDFSGRRGLNSNAAVITAPNYSDTPNAIRGQQILTYLNTPVSSIEIDIGNSVTERDDLLQSDGLLSTIITDRKPTLSADPEAALIGTINWLDVMRNPVPGNTTKHLRYFEAQRPIGEKWIFCAPNAQVKGVTDGDRNSIWTEGLKWDLKRSDALGDDSFWIAFY